MHCTFTSLTFYHTQVPRLFVTDAKKEALTGILIYFVKSKSDIALREQNITSDVNMGVINAADGEGLLSVLEEYMEACIYPPVRTTKDWGVILKEPSGQAVHGNFLGKRDSNC